MLYYLGSQLLLPPTWSHGIKFHHPNDPCQLALLFESVCNKENEGNVCSKTTYLSLQVAIQVHLENSTQPNLCSSFNEGPRVFYYLDTVLPLSEIGVSQIIFFPKPLTSKSNVYRTFQTPSPFFFFFLKNRLYVFQTMSKTQMIRFLSNYQKATIGQNTSLTENQAILKSQLCAYETQISWMMSSIQKGSHGNTKKASRLLQVLLSTTWVQGCLCPCVQVPADILANSAT